MSADSRDGTTCADAAAEGPDRRIAVVSGASSGIGRAAAVHLASVGFDVVAGARRQDRLAELAERVRREGGQCKAVGVDVTDPGAVGRLFSAADEGEGRPAAFVLSAGIGLPGTLLSSNPAGWRNLLEVNLLSVMHQLRASALWLRSRPISHTQKGDDRPTTGASDIVVIGSTAGRDVSAANPVYGATKFAVHSLVESLRREVCRDGIRVTLLEPGFVASEFQQAAGYDRSWLAAVAEDCGPFLTADDVGRLVAFVVCQPPGVHVDDIRVRPTRQRT